MKFGILFLTCALSSILFAQAKPAADLIIINAKVWTVDKANPIAQAVAVLGDRIVAVGSNADVEVLEPGHKSDRCGWQTASAWL